MNIMIVDDHEGIRRIIRTLLVNAFHTDVSIHEFENGVDAIKAHPHIKPDVILMDLELGVMDGFDTAEQILNSDPDSRIIIVTSFDTELHRKRTEELGFTGFVAKDDLKQLISLIKGISDQ